MSGGGKKLPSYAPGVDLLVAAMSKHKGPYPGCTGCMAHHAPRECAACGRPRVVVLQAAADVHALPLCARCYGVLCEVRLWRGGEAL